MAGRRERIFGVTDLRGGASVTGMKRSLTPLLAALFLTGTALADSKYTANAILAKAEEYEQKDVKLDIASVRPMRWKSPIPELAFFWAHSYDRWDNKPAGGILVVVDADQVDQFTRKFGVGRDGRSTDVLRGTLITVRGESSRHPGGFYLIDTTGGRAEELIRNNRELDDRLAEDSGDGDGIPAGKGPRKNRPFVKP